MKIKKRSLALLLFLFGCQNQKDDSTPVPAPPLFTILKPLEFAPEGCLNVELLQKILERNPQGSPAYQVTTNFQVLSPESPSKSLFYAHSAFDLKELSTAQIYLLRNSLQKDCALVSAFTASSQPLVFKVFQAEVNLLKLRLQKNELQNYISQGVDDKLQVFELEIFVKGEHHLRVISRYKKQDTHCRGSKTLKFEIQQDYFWADQVADLPQQLSIDRSFYSKFLTSVGDASPVELVENPLIDVDVLKELRTRALFDAVALCP